MSLTNREMVPHHIVCFVGATCLGGLITFEIGSLMAITVSWRPSFLTKDDPTE